MSTHPHVGDIGTIFQITFVEDGQVVPIEGATDITISFKKPSGEMIEKAATLVADGSDGKIKYTTVEGDLDEDGVWRIQGFVALPSGEWHSEIVNQRIYPNLEVSGA